MLFMANGLVYCDSTSDESVGVASAILLGALFQNFVPTQWTLHLGIFPEW